MEIGKKGYAEQVVTDELLANRVGSGLVAVYATPMMIAGIEGTAAASVAGDLAPGQTTVGCQMNVSHVAATPAGMKVHFETELTAVSANGKMLTFRVTAYDEAGLIGEGEHQRAIVWKDRFEEKAQAKHATRPVAGGKD